MPVWQLGFLNPATPIHAEFAMIYMCSPYSHPDAEVRQARFDAACRAAAALLRQGKTTFSPIAHSHVLCRYGLPTNWEFWRQHDLQYLAACNEVVVLMLDGWERSVGVQAEIEIARELGKPVTFLSVTDRRGEKEAGQ